MSTTDTDPLGDGFKWRLRAELNRITPRYSSPRYLSPARQRIGAWRFAPAGLAAGILGMLGLTAFAATGSPNPVVWTQQIVTKIQPNVAPESSPAPSPIPSPSPHAPAVAPPAPPAPRTEPTERPEGRPSPEHDDGDHGSYASPARTASPSPYSGDH